MKIALGCDHGGYALKQEVIRYLDGRGMEWEDFGCYSEASCDYPDFGRAAAEAVASGKCDRGIVICTTGIGIHRRQQGKGDPLRALRRQRVRRADESA